MKIIIVEGRDRIGKTSLIEYLAKNIQNAVVGQSLNKKNLLKQVHEVRKRTTFFEERHIGILEQVQDQFYTYTKYPELYDNITYIFDRLHWTAFVYAKVLRPDSLNTIFKFDHNMIEFNNFFEQAMQELVPDITLLTFCIPDDAITLQDDFVKDPEELKKINQEYRTISELTKIRKHLHYELSFDYEKNYTDMSVRFESILNDIMTK